jgi:hypothetical protein
MLWNRRLRPPWLIRRTNHTNRSSRKGGAGRKPVLLFFLFGAMALGDES